MSTIVNSGEFSYNNIEFTVYRSSVKARPEEDSAGRTIKYVVYEIEVTGYINAGVNSSTDGTLLTMQRQLLQYGGELIYRDKGSGDIVVNSTATGAWDAAYGPKPTLWSFVPIGNDQTALVTFSVTTKIPICSTATYKFGIAELTYSQIFSIDQHGWQTVTTSGKLEVPATRRDVHDRSLVDHVDSYREQTEPSVPVGFQRIKHHYNIAPDKRSMTWEVVDQQLPTGGMFFGVTANTLHHEMASGLRNGRGFVRWQGTVSGSITMAAEQPRVNAFMVFFGLAAERIAHNARFAINQNQFVQVGLEGLARALNRQLLPNTSNIIITEFRASESITGMETASFSLQYEVTLRDGLNNWLTASGMWQPVRNTNWVDWQASVKGSAHHPRGQARLAAQTSDDRIVDLCAANNNPAVPALRNAQVLFPNQPPRGGVQVLGVSDSDLPPPEKSWLDYQCDLEYRESARLARHVPMGIKTKEPKDLYDIADPTRSTGRIMRGNTSSADSRVPEVFQEVRPPSATVYLFGYAARLGWRIPLPQLIDVPGCEVRQNRIIHFCETVARRFAGIPIYEATWVVEYYLDRPMNQAPPVPNNPYISLDGIS